MLPCTGALMYAFLKALAGLSWPLFTVFTAPCVTTSLALFDLRLGMRVVSDVW